MGLRENSLKKIQNGIDETKDFDAGNVHGEWFPIGHFGRNNVGRLDEQEAKLLIERNEKVPVFAVFSYRTPIAHVAKGYDWHVTEQYFSKTTEHHKKVVSLAKNHYSFYNRTIDT